MTETSSYFYIFKIKLYSTMEEYIAVRGTMLCTCATEWEEKLPNSVWDQCSSSIERNLGSYRFVVIIPI